MKDFYITTAIDYANGSPHLGHAYEKILADVIARTRRLSGRSCHLLTGLDEHGQKVQQTAEKRGILPQQLCDGVAMEFQALCRELHISNDDYIRTTESRHQTVVRDVLRKLHEKGDIYFAEYSGLYSPRAEQFVQEKDRVDGKWPEEFGEIITLKEANYFFKLAQYQDWLIDFLRQKGDFIFPSFRQKQVLEFLREPLNDLCISRPKSRLSWGIPLPFDENYVTYVWFDALLSYISAVGYGSDDFERCWPADFHVIGKDILVPPHAVYWPIMLHAMGLPLPQHLLAHGWWRAKDGEKMSKSLGNTVQPLDYIRLFGADAFRYFVTREMALGQDSNFSHELFLARYNGELANDLGNLLSRLINMIIRYGEGKIPPAEIEESSESELKMLWESVLPRIRSAYENLEFNLALEQLFQFIRGINRYAELRAPWKLAKSADASDRQRLSTALATMAEGLRLAVILLLPVMPQIGAKILQILGSESVANWENLQWGCELAGRTVGPNVILFPRAESLEF